MRSKNAAPVTGSIVPIGTPRYEIVDCLQILFRESAKSSIARVLDLNCLTLAGGN